MKVGKEAKLYGTDNTFEIRAGKHLIFNVGDTKAPFIRVIG